MEGVEIKENDGRGDFKYDIFDILQELLWMPQCAPTQCNYLKNSLKKEFPPK
jgi:hypothetical protein